MYENAFKAIETLLRNHGNMSSDVDYVEQTTWLLFLKYLSDLETEREARAEISGKKYKPILESEFSWRVWACPKLNGQFDDDNALIGQDLIDFVDRQLFPYLATLRSDTNDPNTIQYKIGQIFSELRSRFRDGYILRDVIAEVQKLSFKKQDERHELSELYETRIHRMSNAGRKGGEYYTPRPLIRAMVRVIDPKIGETIYDGAVGSAGFLCEAYDYLKSGELSATDYDTLQNNTFFGQEKNALPFVVGIINMILHGIEAPNLVLSNSLNQNVLDIQEADRHDIVLANPPFGGGEATQIQTNFPIRSGETAYLFLQHFIRKLKKGGRAAVVIKNTFLSNDDAKELRRELLESCNLHTILDCPKGTFQGANVLTVVLFFTKGTPTKETWYYKLDPGRSLGKSNPINDNDLAEFIKLQNDFSLTEKSWSLNTKDIDLQSYDMSVKNPNIEEEAPLRPPEVIIKEILNRDEQTADILRNIRELL